MNGDRASGRRPGTARGDRGELRAFIRAARRSARGRTVLFAAIDVVLLAAAATLAGAGLTAWTLRGDLTRPAWLAIVGLGGVGWLLRTWVRSRRRWGDPLRAARSIAALPRPLSHQPDPRSARSERLLRHELLGAFELELGLARGDGSTGSTELARQYVTDVAARLRSPRIDPALALPRPWGRPRWVSALMLGLSVALFTLWPPTLAGLTMMAEGVDARPPSPPEPVWSSLTLELDYPPHTGRARRIVPNPSGALRVVAGTTVHVDLVARRSAEAGRIVLSYDAPELGESPPPEIIDLQAAAVPEPEPGTDRSELEPGTHWQGSFVARGAGSWTLVLLDDPDDGIDEATRRSGALPLQLEPDRPPEVELLPLPRAAREVSETDEVDLRFVARDDFGVVSAELVYQLPDGTSHRLPAGETARPTRTWSTRHTWDISQIPIAERSEVLYWIEVRDNDPGLGLVPLPDPPGKVTRSATMRLLVKDDEAEHAANIAALAEIRDAAVDVLGQRMTTPAFDVVPEPSTTEPALGVPPLSVRVTQARDVLHRSQQLLTMMATAIDALSMDTLTHERDVEVLTGIHGRLMKLHREELEQHEGLPPGIERSRPDEAGKALRSMAPHNARSVGQLEDEVIRLDDLVDGQIIERLEALVARLEATQRKLVELLEQLRAGDESVRAQIDQLEQRRREDLRRIAEARAMLRREVDEEFMNLDAFEILEQMAQREQLSEMLRRGEVDQALEQARGQLGDVQQLRDQVQERVGQGAATPAVSEEERKRMQLLRELSRLQDEQGTLRSQTRKLHEKWRDEVSNQVATPDARERAAEQAKSVREALDEVNDARLGREGRRGLEDAKDALQRLETLSQDEQSAQLDLTEAAERALRALEQAVAGSEEREKEGQALRRASRRVQGLERSMRSSLPSPDQALGDEEGKRLQELWRRQAGLRERADQLLDSDVAEPLPAPGRKAMRQADKAMQGSAEGLEGRLPRDALQEQNQAWERIQEAIDSLRRGSPPPPTSSSGGDASTEAERDRSLRDQLMDAMKEGAPDGYAEPVKRYYEELLR